MILVELNKFEIRGLEKFWAKKIEVKNFGKKYLKRGQIFGEKIWEPPHIRMGLVLRGMVKVRG